MKRWSLGDFNPLDILMMRVPKSVCEPDRTLAEANQAYKLCGRGSALLDTPGSLHTGFLSPLCYEEEITALMAEC